MEFSVIMESQFFALVILPFLIFFARIIDVSMGTVRVIFIAKGMKVLAPLIGFFEVLIWIVAIGQIMGNLTSPLYYIAYAAGFSAGTYIGMWIEEKIAIGVVSLRIITRSGADELVEELRGNNYGVTSLAAEGKLGSVNIIFMMLSRTDLNSVIATVKKYNPRAFYSVEDVRFVSEGIFPNNHRNNIPHRGLKRFKRRVNKKK
jgi:uncharacterized protein YebE (UPF0316 family)